MALIHNLRAQFPSQDRRQRAGSVRLPMNPVTRWAFRVSGAGLLVAMAWIHLHLYSIGYSSVKTIGPLFLLNGVVGSIAALAVLVTPARWLALVTAAGALLDIGTLGALVLSLTVGLFGFTESTSAPLIRTTLAVETAGFLVLAAHALYDGQPLLQEVRQRVHGRRRAPNQSATGRGDA